MSTTWITDVWHVRFEPKVWFDQNFSTLQYNKNLKKIINNKATYFFLIPWILIFFFISIFLHLWNYI